MTTFCNVLQQTVARWEQETLVNTFTTDNQSLPSITALPDGGYVASWHSLNQDGNGFGIYVQRFAWDSSRVGEETAVNTFTTGYQSTPVVAALNDGGYVVAWHSDNQDGSSWGVYNQRFAADGTKVGAEVRVNTTTNGEQSTPAIKALADGGYVVVWHSNGQDGDSYGIYAQRYAADGRAIGGETLVNTVTVGNQSIPTIAALSDGGYVITWQSAGQDGDSYGIYSQRFAPMVYLG